MFCAGKGPTHRAALAIPGLVVFHMKYRNRWWWCYFHFGLFRPRVGQEGCTRCAIYCTSSWIIPFQGVSYRANCRWRGGHSKAELPQGQPCLQRHCLMVLILNTSSDLSAHSHNHQQINRYCKHLVAVQHSPNKDVGNVKDCPWSILPPEDVETLNTNCNPIHTYLEESNIELNGTYFWIIMHRIVGQEY